LALEAMHYSLVRKLFVNQMTLFRRGRLYDNGINKWNLRKLKNIPKLLLFAHETYGLIYLYRRSGQELEGKFTVYSSFNWLIWIEYINIFYSEEATDININPITGEIFFVFYFSSKAHILSYNPTSDTFGQAYTFTTSNTLFAIAPIGNFLYMAPRISGGDVFYKRVNIDTFPDVDTEAPLIQETRSMISVTAAEFVYQVHPTAITLTSPAGITSGGVVISSVATPAQTTPTVIQTSSL
jgi:hypothetical protein